MKYVISWFIGGSYFAPRGLFNEYWDIQQILKFGEKALEECKNEYQIQETHQ